MAGRCYDPLPSPTEALQAPLRAFPGWYLRMVCGQCGRERYLSETYTTLSGTGDLPISRLIARLRHDGCGGEPKFVELITDVPGVGRPVRRIVPLDQG
jgi:hypothetical protein